MTAERFLDLLIAEIKVNEALRGYYRFLNDPAKTPFREAYYFQRLQYIERHLPDLGSYVWDCGCGYGTTNLFLAMNGVRSFGNTLEYYDAQIPARLDYWNAFGDTSLFGYSYADTYDLDLNPEVFTGIIAQDTLHHLEPLPQALDLFFHSLKPGGAVVNIEENGSNVIQSLKLFRQRGFKRVIQFEDEKLGKTITMGNENIRSLGKWRRLFEAAGFTWETDDVEFLRILPPGAFQKEPIPEVVAREKQIIAHWPLLRRFFSFGINFTAKKPDMS